MYLGTSQSINWSGWTGSQGNESAQTWKVQGQDDLEKFDKWLSHLLKYYCTFKVTRPNHDKDQVLYTRLYLEGLASQ